MAQNLVLNILAKDKTRQALSGVQAGLTRLRSSIFSIQSALAGIGGALVIKSFVNVGRSVEELGLRFNFLFGSAREGAKAFDTLVNFASRVPFSLEEISQASGNLAVVSKDAKELEKNLKIVGNVASVTGLDFRTTAEQIQRSFAGGISSADIFRERGVRALLGFQAGATVSIEETRKAFEREFGEGGRFAQATEVLSTTFTGTLSMLSDKIFKFKLETNRSGFFDFLKSGLKVINNLIEQNAKVFDDFADRLGKSLINATKGIILGSARIIDGMRPIFEFIGTALFGLFKIFDALPPTVREIGLIGFLILGTKGRLALLGIGYILEKLGVDLKAIKEKITGNNDEIEKQGELTSKVKHFFSLVDGEVIKTKENLDLMTSRIEEANKQAKALNSEFEKTAQTVSDGIKKPLEDLKDIGKQITNVLDMGIKGFSKGIAESIVLGKELKATFKSIGQTLAVTILQTLIEIIARETVLLAIEKAKLTYKTISASLSTSNALSGLGSLKGFFGGRASGGSVQKGQPYMVGERGAELFIPNQSGQITQSARGTGGGQTTVNFNINTLDASGFEDLLVRSRGTITSIINNAVNERGEGSII